MRRRRRRHLGEGKKHGDEKIELLISQGSVIV